MRRIGPLLGALLALQAAPADAFRLERGVVPQPRVLYHVDVPDWRKPMARVAHAINRARVGVRLVEAGIAEHASIRVGRLRKRCGYPGINGTTQTLAGGFAAIYLPRGCDPAQASIIAGHEVGHALGLKHEDRRCALMNSSGTGRRSVPTECVGQRHPWLRAPFRRDDLRGLRLLYRNAPPVVRVDVDGPREVPAGTTVAFRIRARDAERNLSEVHVDYGDGAREERVAGEPLPRSHTYLAPGTYRLRATALDLYGRRAADSVTITVT